MHQGRLELVTWTSHPDADGERTGFAAVVLSEVEDVKKMFKTKFKGDEEKFFKWRPAAFRWTCCGLDAQRNYGCDHHDVRYPQPCTCDFCMCVGVFWLYSGCSQAIMGSIVWHSRCPMRFTMKETSIGKT